MWRVIPVDAITREALHAGDFQNFHDLPLNAISLITIDTMKQHGVFKTTSITSATTTTVATPKAGGSIIVTDLVVSAKKVAGTTLAVEFNDGTDTEIIIDPDSVNQSVNFAWAPNGRIQGWRDASIKVVTTGANTVATVTVGYMHVSTSIKYDEWTAVR